MRDGAAGQDQERYLNSQKPTLTLTLSQRERGLTEVLVRSTPTWDIESNSSVEKPIHQPLSQRGLTEVLARATPTWGTESNSSVEKPIHQPLSRGERGLTEVLARGTPTWDTESNSSVEKPINQPPLPRERAGVRGEHTTRPKADRLRFSPLKLVCTQNLWERACSRKRWVSQPDIH